MKTTNLDQSSQIPQPRTTISLEQALSKLPKQFPPVSKEAQDKLQQQAQQIRDEEETYLNSQWQPEKGSDQSIQPSQTISSSQASLLQRQPTLEL
jgi:hypothetical protein